MAAINLPSSRVSPINYTASVERTPINVKNGNRFKRMAELAASVEEGFILLPFSPGEVMIPSFAYNLTMEDFITARGQRFPDLGEDLLSFTVKQEDKSS